jgi:hypothetical protein
VLGGAAFVGLASAAILFFGIRAWRMSRLFGRQYLFPVRKEVALRLGGDRSGGLMATARFGDTARPIQVESEAKQS